MKIIALLSKDDKTVLFTQTAAKMEMHPSIAKCIMKMFCDDREL